MSMPTISINIPCYNRSKMIKECIESFINQTYQDWELILVDDGSTEDLSFVIGIDKKKRVRYYPITHAGIAKAFNYALDKSSGQYIMPFGSDDLATPKLLQETIDLMEKYKNKFDVIYSNGWSMNTDGIKHRIKNSKTLNRKEAYNQMLNRQYIPHPGSLWKKDKIPRYDESLESAVDWELFLTAMERGVRFKHLNQKLWIYRVGHLREGGSQRQIDCCDKVLRRRGYYFDSKIRRGIKIK